MTKEGSPFPNPSNVPLITTETAETIKPALMTRRAIAPCSAVCGVFVNIPINCTGHTRHRIVPMTITMKL